MQNIVNHVQSHIEQNMKYSFDVCSALADGVSYVYGMAVVGDIAEFGTMSGTTAVAVALATAMITIEGYFNHTLPVVGGFKNLWLFDSFEGLPQARFDIDANSHHVKTGIWGKNTCRGLAPEQLSFLIKQVMGERAPNIVKGWFKDTLPKIPQDKIFSLVHIDSDLYESAIDVLDSLFARKMIAKGAVIFFDDFDCNAANPALGERRAWAEVVGKYQIQYSDLGGYGVASHRFIVHDYC